jgi:ABC-type cobalamin/Fe3+-siderophores transport system ATPase subunit
MNEILNKENGAKLYKCDLHIHTPVSKCYKQSDIVPEDIVNTAIERGLNVIAITDHNTEEWFEKVSKAVEGKNLLVLPGVEVTTPHGGERQVHILAIFDPNDSKRVNELLTKIGIPHEKRGESDAVSAETIPKIMEIVDSMGGISILSHVDSNCGIDVEMLTSTPTKQLILESPHLRGIEVTRIETRDKYEKCACVQSSDAHSLDEIGQRCTLIKMGEPSFEGLRQALGDYESRIKLNGEELFSYPYIVGIKFEGGFLDGQIIHFNESLNSLIGGKGTGKSTIIELIRYTMDSLSNDSKIRENEEKQIKDVLGHGKIKLLVRANNGENYIIERTHEENPKILRDNGEKTSIDIKRFREEFFNIEAYSQNELLEIARSFENQLKMIDQYINFRDLIDKKSNILGELEVNERSILEKSKYIDDLKSQSNELELIKEKLRTLGDKGVKDKLEDHVFWGDGRRILESIKKQLETEIGIRASNLEQFGSSKFKIPKVDNLEKLPNKKIISKSISILNRSKRKIENRMKKEIEILQKDVSEICEICENWNKKYQQKKEGLRKLLSELEKEGIPVKDYEDYLELEKKKKDLEEIVKQIKIEENEVNDLEKQRKEKLEKLKQNRKDIFNRRHESIRKINASLEGFVRVKIEKEGDNYSYKEFLVDDILSSATHRISKSDRAKIADKLHPIKLAEILEEEDIGSLEKEVNISEEVAQKAVILAKSKLYKVQTTELEDKITVELNDYGWKELSSCSDGQKCTAILSIAMFERDIPLLIDQPEDSLDNSFIYKEVVKIIRKIKNKRQLIIATHNANIPVLGDSELISVMVSNGKNGFVTERGVIDKDKIKIHVQNILEGGKEAFERRKLKYGI